MPIPATASVPACQDGTEIISNFVVVDGSAPAAEATKAERDELKTAVKLLEEANEVLMTDVVKAASFGLKGKSMTAASR